jgi:hypothetical protein
MDREHIKGAADKIKGAIDTGPARSSCTLEASSTKAEADAQST